MKREIIKSICGSLLVLAGMVGLYFKIEYSGWVILLGAIVILDPME